MVAINFLVFALRGIGAGIYGLIDIYEDKTVSFCSYAPATPIYQKPPCVFWKMGC